MPKKVDRKKRPVGGVTVPTTSSVTKRPGEVGLKQSRSENLLRQLSSQTATSTSSVIDRVNAALGCKTSDVALAILAQVVRASTRQMKTS